MRVDRQSPQPEISQKREKKEIELFFKFEMRRVGRKSFLKWYDDEKTVSSMLKASNTLRKLLRERSASSNYALDVLYQVSIAQSLSEPFRFRDLNA